MVLKILILVLVYTSLIIQTLFLIILKKKKPLKYDEKILEIIITLIYISSVHIIYEINPYLTLLLLIFAIWTLFKTWDYEENEIEYVYENLLIINEIIIIIFSVLFVCKLVYTQSLLLLPTLIMVLIIKKIHKK